MKYSYVLILPALLSCAQMVPARSTELSPGRHELTATGNTFSSRAELQKKVDAKAARICGAGPFIYEGNGEFEVKKTESYAVSGRMDTSYFELTRIVVCTEG